MKSTVNRQNMIYTEQTEYELTREGWIVCAAAGLLEELTVFAVLGIELMQTPVPVFLVLWAAFGIMSSGFLALTVSLRSRRAAAVECRFAAEYATFPAAAEVYEAEQQYAFSAQRKAS